LSILIVELFTQSHMLQQESSLTLQLSLL